MKRREEFREKFISASNEEQLIMLAIVDAFLAGLLASKEGKPQAESAPTLDREVWGEIEELL